MPVPNQRDPDGIDIIRAARTGLDDLKKLVISRWGRVPHVAADPASPPDGAVWIRSDLRRFRFRANGLTVDAGDAKRIEVRARRVAAQSAANATEVNIIFDTIDVDTSSQQAGGVFTAGTAGEYAVTLSGTMAAIPLNRFFAYISITSALTGVTRKIRNPGPTEDQFTVTAMLPLAAADFFTCGVFHTNGSAINITDAWLHVLRVSD